VQAHSPLLITLEAHPRVGGVATYLHSCLSAVQGASYAPRLVAPAGATGAAIALPCDHSQSPLNLWQASRALRHLSAPYVYIAEAAALRAALWAWDWTCRQRIRLVLHGSELLALGHSERFIRLLHQAERIYTLSATVAQKLLSLTPVDPQRIIITGAAPSPHLTAIDGIRQRQRLLTVARLHPRKGQQVILDLMASGQLSGYSYDIVGPIRRSAYARQLQQTIVRHQLPAELHGQRDEGQLSLFYAQAGIFVLPATASANRMEGYGLALIDAAAMGLPAVAYDSGGIAEVVRHCRTGLLVPEGDSKALAAALHQLTKDDELYAELSAGALTWANAQSWRTVAEKLFAP
jgi:glycosyltransferase involved in cell wall biosynthesis